MCNHNLLRAKIKENGLSETEFAKALNIAPSSLSARFNNKAEWRLTDLTKTKEVLHLTDSDFIAIFMPR